MKRNRHNSNKCPWCGKEATRPVVDPETGVLFDFCCEGCGAPIPFCSLGCAWQANLKTLKEDGLSGKDARAYLMARWHLVEPPSALA